MYLQYFSSPFWVILSIRTKKKTPSYTIIPESKIVLLNFYLLLYVHDVCKCMCKGTHAWVRGQLCGVGSFFPTSCGFLGWNSSLKTCLVSLFAEPSHCP